ncbi:hypothetical protein H180DRAFT_04119 [Streptomyces sp. WMMB 322]|nr:hypothetical protein H180DRAFT_04119 [Streptomyces sp. WMMB 322]
MCGHRLAEARLQPGHGEETEAVPSTGLTARCHRQITERPRHVIPRNT